MARRKKCPTCNSQKIKHMEKRKEIHLYCSICGFEGRYVRFHPCGCCDLEILTTCSNARHPSIKTDITCFPRRKKK